MSRRRSCNFPRVYDRSFPRAQNSSLRRRRIFEDALVLYAFHLPFHCQCSIFIPYSLFVSPSPTVSVFFFFFNTRPVRVPGARARAEVVNFSSGAVRILQKPATRSVGLIPRSYLSIISYGSRIYIVSYEKRGSDYYLNN